MTRSKKTSGPSVPVKAKVQPVPKTPAERLEQFAGWINGEAYFPASAASPQMCRALLDAGLVTTERLRERGLTY